MRYFFDTSALLVHYQGARGSEQMVELFGHEQHAFYLSVLSLVEFGRKLKELGVPAAEMRQTLAAYEHLFHKVLPVDQNTAQFALELALKIRPRLPMIDSLIAASARQADACLVHLDAHFSAIPKNLLTQLALGA